MLLTPSGSSSASSGPTPQTPAQQLLTSLRSPIALLGDLEDILLRALAALGSIPLPFKPSSKYKSELRAQDALRVIPIVQHIILNAILPVWLTPLRDAGHEQLIREFFCPHIEPPGNSQTSPIVKSSSKIATSALPTLLLHIQTLNTKDAGPAAILHFCVSMLGDIISLYPPDVVHDALFSGNVGIEPRMDGRLMQEWEDYVRSACSLPGKVANAMQGTRDLTPNENLQQGPYFSNVCVSAEKILFRISQQPSRETLLQSHSSLLLKLLNLGLFPPSPPSLPSQPSFFTSTLSIIRRRLHLTNVAIASSEAASFRYSATWAAVINSLPSTLQQTFVASLFGALDCYTGRDTSSSAHRKIEESKKLLRGLLGKLYGNNVVDENDENDELWGVVSALICGSRRTWDIGVVRAVVCWIADPQDSNVDSTALEKLLDATVALWTNPEYIRHSLLSQHRYTTSLFLIILASFASPSPAIEKLGLFVPFVSSISTYIGHLDVEVRRCGMLVAEVVAARCNKKLNFDGWDGVGESKDWARAMRGWQPDWTAEGFHLDEPPETSEKNDNATTPDPGPDTTPPPPPPHTPPDSDDDSLQGYDSPSSSRAPSPTPSELDEIEKDPTLRLGHSKPVAKPVYLLQLAKLLRSDKNDEEGAAERIQVALAGAEALIRRKKGFGLELEENAVELAIALIQLKDNYELTGFDEQRQGALNALVECSPRQAAMTLVEQFFTNQYAILERHVILTALAIGARALAGLPVPPARVPRMSVTFPSKMLPPALHRRYGTPQEQARAGQLQLQGNEGREESEVQQLVRGITGPALQRNKVEAEDAIPQAARTRRLRLGSSRGSGRGRISEVRAGEGWDERAGTGRMPGPHGHDHETFAAVAAEHFIMPLVNHMWLHLRDTDTRTTWGAGAGVILGATVLAQYLGALAVLTHAARHAPPFVAVVAPGVVELAVALGNRRVDDPIGGGSEDADANEYDEAGGKEATVLTAALELTLVTLDACIDLDGGRTLALEHAALLLAVGEWAGSVLDVLGKGRRMSGGGGAVEGRIGGAAAGVVLSIEKITERWGRSMVAIGF
ncbi:hypothetical protein K439DRAFT_945232 [Ramaria rubella]|nr:hypothetical protein K439DRAFT_945232 [Ramaria rubella]